MFENPAPSMFSMAFPGLENSRLAACINWKDHAHKLQADFAALGLDPDAEYHVFSHWDEKYLGALSGGVAFRNVPAHGCRLLSITPAGGVPAAVGSNLHITSGRIEIKEQRYDAESNTLSVSLALPGKRGGKLFISVPDEIFPESVKNTGGGTAELASHDKRICAVEVGFRDSMEFKVAFGKNA
jgi:hypothetical protein